MPPKQKDPEEASSAPLQKHCSHASKTPVVNPEAKLEPWAPKIQWDLNECWTDHLIEYLTENLDVWLKMFSDSVKDARKESCKKVCFSVLMLQSSADTSQVVGSKPKVEYYHEIAKAIFDIEGKAECKMYVLDPEHYAMSVMGWITQ